ncbi:hypothetical protein [Listeria booriae]|uniref:Bacterial Ig domain-containing protein n=1 Tax=Listeria booriae TaxID=1552123 RepID=A0A7X1DI58_9LIST|nr:hypothetical protein [Listeria booriae]MBC2285475.1 hypothetical protein [Listeria booriae]MBC2293931.1 hypothetical protein [Listeria booriae]MBC2305927.1 hypothetical protein [Listeria booriae]MBC2309464.1 hypothetical protein [Listeria booriae]
MKKRILIVAAGLGITLGGVAVGNPITSHAAIDPDIVGVGHDPIQNVVPVLAGNILDSSKYATFIGPSNAILVVNGQSYRENTNGIFHVRLPNYLDVGDSVVTKFISTSSGVSSATRVYTTTNGTTIDPQVSPGATRLCGSTRPDSRVTLFVNGEDAGSALSFGSGQWNIRPSIHIPLGSNVSVRVTSINNSYTHTLSSPVYRVTTPNPGSLPKGPQLVQTVTDQSKDILFTATPYARVTLLGTEHVADSAGIVHVILGTTLRAGTTLTATMIDDYSHIREPLTFTVISSR